MISNTHAIRPLFYQFQPHLSSSHYPLHQHLLSILQRCQHKSQYNQIHAQMISTGLIHNPLVCSKLVASLASTPLSGTTCTAHFIANQHSGLDTYTWNTIIRGYWEEHNPKQALHVYAHVVRVGMPPIDSYTLVFAIKACGLLGSVVDGELVHAHVIKLGFAAEAVIATSTVGMYGVFGKLGCARRVFDESPERDLVLWNTLLAVCAQSEVPEMAIAVLRSMIEENVKPNGVTMASVLSACSCSRSHLRPSMEHYGCVVDLLCRAGLIHEALEVLGNMPMKPDAIIWRTLMKACQNQGNASLARHIMSHLLELEPEYSGNHIIVSNLQAYMGEWRSVEKTRTEMGVQGATKGDPGTSFLATSCTA